MTIDIEEAMKAVELLAKDNNMQLCVEESFKGSVLTAIFAFIGSMFMGPIGLIIGAVVGSVISAKRAKKYKPVYQVFQEMNEREKLKLFQHVTKVIQQLKIEDGVMLMALVTNPAAAEHALLQKQILSYFGTVQPGT